ncbi:hypothetical protein KCV26_16085 [Petrimonas sulfuriphila]|jgi:hypothetical protein
MRTEQTPTEKPAEFYTAPQIEVVDIELVQNIMGSTDTLPDIPLEDW